MSHSSDLAGSDALHRSAEPAAAPARRSRVLLVDVEPALAALIGEWLDEIGVDAVDAADDRAVDLVVVDVPYPRQGVLRLRGLGHARPATPVLALSPTFFAGVAASGSVARELGVAGVLATPVRREALVAAVRGLLGRAG